MGYVTNYKISFIHFGKTEMPKEADVEKKWYLKIVKRH